MNLNIHQTHISEELDKDLGFHQYLQLFSRPIPLLPSKLLRPLAQKEAEEHFARINELFEQNNSGKINLEQLLGQAALSPNLDTLLPFFLQGEMAPYHLFELTQFISNELCLLRIESSGAYFSTNEKEQRIQLQEKILSLLEEHTECGGAHLKLPLEVATHQQKIKEIDELFRQAIHSYESEILKQSGLRLIYPYPLEVPSLDDRLNKAKKCSLLTIHQKENVEIIDYSLTPELKSLIDRQQAEHRALKEKSNSLMQKINLQLSPFGDDFKQHYLWRQQQTYRYILADVMIKNNLAIPQITNGQGISLIQGELPILKNSAKKSYSPLSIELHQGANLLYGANMAGKTTVIKSLYFLLKLTSLGLPVPAHSLRCDFPKQLEILLKSSGSIGKNISSFGEELEFFCKNFQDDSYIFVDELFQTTNPQSGVQLSQLVLETFSSKKITFFATTHYPELIHSTKTKLYRMKEMQFARELDRSLSSKDLLGKIPFQIEKIEGDLQAALAVDQSIPLTIAAHFPLFPALLEKVQKAQRESRPSSDLTQRNKDK